MSDVVLKLGRLVPRGTDAVKCRCGGYAEMVEPTPEEMVEYGCGRVLGCCSRAFVCGLCGSRLVGSAEAPELDW